MRLIGITGGIGTGKSTATKYLHDRYHLPVWDADIYARLAVAIGSPILTNITQRYGKDILLADRSLDRTQLGQIVFANPNERQWLEAQIHPYVRDCFEGEIDRLSSEGVAVLAIPLLFEAHMSDLTTEIWVVSCDRATQVRRVMARDGIDEIAANQRIDSQMPLAQKIAQADVNIDNSNSLADLTIQIDRVIDRA
jgi:dephospho-CoA kinase